MSILLRAYKARWTRFITSSEHTLVLKLLDEHIDSRLQTSNNKHSQSNSPNFSIITFPLDEVYNLAWTYACLKTTWWAYWFELTNLE